MNLLVIILGYLIGAIPIGYIFGKIKGIDVREVGFRRIGTSNIHKIFGFIPAVCIFFGDFLKPILALLLAIAITGSELVAAITGIVAIIGHNWPIYLKFKGDGRGIASSVGLLYFLIPIEMLISFSFLFLLGLLIKLKGTAFFVFILFCIIPCVTLFFNEPIWIFWICLSISILVFVVRISGGVKKLRKATNKWKTISDSLFFDK